LFNVFGNVDPAERDLLESMAKILDGSSEIPLSKILNDDLDFIEDQDDITDAQGFIPKDISPAAPSEVPASGPAIAVINDPHKRISLSDETVTIGRRGDNIITLEADRQVSRQHCRVFARDGRWYIVDCGSIHGTWIDGEKILKRQLFGGEKIQVGVYTLQFSA